MPPSPPVFPPRPRSLHIESLRSSIFNTRFNPSAARTGVRHLQDRLRGPTLTSYYTNALFRHEPTWDRPGQREPTNWRKMNTLYRRAEEVFGDAAPGGEGGTETLQSVSDREYARDLSPHLFERLKPSDLEFGNRVGRDGNDRRELRGLWKAEEEEKVRWDMVPEPWSEKELKLSGVDKTMREYVGTGRFRKRRMMLSMYLEDEEYRVDEEEEDRLATGAALKARGKGPPKKGEGKLKIKKKR
ncbi:hypothetical protein BT69DRAFT_1336328 [Atractiella rhizophila]|nr:hypothetical protein BT69DRAFT_1336328 [Atractiella rhizophila]